MIPGIGGILAGVAEAAAVGGVTLSAVTVDVDTAVDASSQTFTVSSLPSGDKILLILIWADAPISPAITVSSVTRDSGAETATVICTPSSATDVVAGYFFTGVTGTSAEVVVTFSNTAINTMIAHAVITGTDEDIYHSRSGATPTTVTASSITSPAITIPTGGVGLAVEYCIADHDQVWSQDGAGSGSEDVDQTVGSAAQRGSVYHTSATDATQFTATGSSAARKIFSFSWGP